MAPYIYAHTVSSSLIDVESITSELVSTTAIMAPYFFADTISSSSIDVESLTSSNILALHLCSYCNLILN